MPNHIKIDVDGIEPKVIAGAKETLQSQELRSLMIEINDDLPDDLEMIFYLESLGFKATPALRPRTYSIGAQRGTVAGLANSNTVIPDLIRNPATPDLWTPDQVRGDKLESNPAEVL